MVSDENAADAAIEESRRRVDTARTRVRQQLEGMDILVSGCTIEQCNGRFQWVADQVISQLLLSQPNKAICSAILDTLNSLTSV
jgi:hypothetical protein